MEYQGGREGGERYVYYHEGYRLGLDRFGIFWDASCPQGRIITGSAGFAARRIRVSVDVRGFWLYCPFSLYLFPVYIALPRPALLLRHRRAYDTHIYCFNAEPVTKCPHGEHVALEDSLYMPA